MKTILVLFFPSIVLLRGVTPHFLLAQNEVKRQLIHQSQRKLYSPKNETASTAASQKVVQNNQSLPSFQQRISSFHRSFSKFVGESLSAVGLLSSMIVSSPEALFFQQPMTNLHIYLRETGIGEEFGNVFNRKMFGPLMTLSKIQSKYRATNDVRDLVLSKNNNSSSVKKIPSMQEAARYMRFATAAYGDHMMRGARFGRKMAPGSKHEMLLWFRSFLPKTFFSPTTQQRIGAHCGIPACDVVHIDIEYGSRRNHLCHFVAVDHAHKAIILSIRGTFSLSDLIVDATGFSKPFCGGEAHAHMASMAERTWNVSRPYIDQALSQNKDYSLVLTGHSLGAGVACLVHILVPPSSFRKKCFVYGCPPVFSPLELVPKHVVDSTTCYIHGEDTVPFLSMTSIRKLADDIQTIKEKKQKEKNAIFRRSPFKVFQSNSASILNGDNKKIVPKRGSPLMIIPASIIVWSKQQNSDNNHDPGFDYKLCDPTKLARLGIPLSKRAMADHALAIYEEALHYFEEQEATIL